MPNWRADYFASKDDQKPCCSQLIEAKTLTRLPIKQKFSLVVGTMWT